MSVQIVFPSFNGKHSNTEERKLHRFTRKHNFLVQKVTSFHHLNISPVGWRSGSRCLCPQTRWRSDGAGRSSSSFCHTDTKVYESCKNSYRKVTGGLFDCSRFDIFMSVLDRALGRGGVKFPPLLVIPGA